MSDDIQTSRARVLIPVLLATAVLALAGWAAACAPGSSTWQEQNCTYMGWGWSRCCYTVRDPDNNRQSCWWQQQ
ncbi:MAG TPA: hypothetical protein VM681_09640 [Candidatus Thermoplasmatota archaeon]|nr:hypothetical protein [Candidatus Thermoplasmatota archaeon]